MGFILTFNTAFIWPKYYSIVESIDRIVFASVIY